MDTGERGGVLKVAEGVLVHGDDRDGREQVEDEHRSLDGQHPARRLTLAQRKRHENWRLSGLQQPPASLEGSEAAYRKASAGLGHHASHTLLNTILIQFILVT